MIKGMFFIAALMMTSVSVVHANTGDQATSISVNPGPEMNEDSGRSKVEGNASEPGLVEVYCKDCPNHKKYIRLADQTNKKPSYDFLKPGTPVEPGPGGGGTRPRDGAQ